MYNDVKTRLYIGLKLNGLLTCYVTQCCVRDLEQRNGTGNARRELARCPVPARQILRDAQCGYAALRIVPFAIRVRVCAYGQCVSHGWEVNGEDIVVGFE